MVYFIFFYLLIFILILERIINCYCSNYISLFPILSIIISINTNLSLNITPHAIDIELFTTMPYKSEEREKLISTIELFSLIIHYVYDFLNTSTLYL